MVPIAEYKTKKKRQGRKDEVSDGDSGGMRDGDGDNPSTTGSLVRKGETCMETGLARCQMTMTGWQGALREAEGQSKEVLQVEPTLVRCV